MPHRDHLLIANSARSAPQTAFSGFSEPFCARGKTAERSSDLAEVRIRDELARRRGFEVVISRAPTGFYSISYSQALRNGPLP